MACLIAFLRQMDEEQYEMYMKNLGLKIDILVSLNFSTKVIMILLSINYAI